MLREVVVSGVLIAAFSVVAPKTVSAAEVETSVQNEVMVPPKKSPPAKVYSGSAPIDLSRGVSFTNGTYGFPNEEYEAFSKGDPQAPGLTQANYPFAQKEHFVSTVDSLMDIYREGLQNLKDSKDNRPELVQYRQTMEASLHDKIEAADKALKTAKSSDANGWDEAQKNARVAFNDLQALFVRKP